MFGGVYETDRCENYVGFEGCYRDHTNHFYFSTCIGENTQSTIEPVCANVNGNSACDCFH